MEPNALPTLDELVKKLIAEDAAHAAKIKLTPNDLFILPKDEDTLERDEAEAEEHWFLFRDA